MLVYVLNKDGKPLMPCKPRKTRKLLEANKAKVVKRTPFTIQYYMAVQATNKKSILVLMLEAKLLDCLQQQK